RNEAESPHPLRTLPEIEVRYQQACRTSVTRCKRGVIEFRDDECLAVQQICHRQVGRVTPVAVCHHVSSRRRGETRSLEQGIESDAAQRVSSLLHLVTQ